MVDVLVKVVRIIVPPMPEGIFEGYQLLVTFVMTVMLVVGSWGLLMGYCEPWFGLRRVGTWAIVVVMWAMMIGAWWMLLAELGAGGGAG